VQRWTFDTYAAVWLFTDNDEYFTGRSVRHQEPIVAVQAHVVYTLARRGWLAGDLTFYQGGESTVDGAPASGSYHNTRVGGTFAWPIGQRQSVKVGYSAGATTRLGADFQTLTVGWQMLFF
jgi:hypothetical protein